TRVGSPSAHPTLWEATDTAFVCGTGLVPLTCGSFGNLTDRVQYPHCSTCMRGLCHGLPSLFLPVGARRLGVAVSHAPLRVAKRRRCRVLDAPGAPPPPAQASPRAEPLGGPHHHAALRRLCARQGPSPARPLSAATAPHPHAGAPSPGRHRDALLPQPGLGLSGLGRLGPSPRQQPPPWRSLAPAAGCGLSWLCSRNPWHALAWPARLGRPQRACHRLPR